jgi:hypothetical protein
MLLESIESGKSGRAAVLQGVRDKVRFFVTAYGALDTNDVFRLRWLKDETTEEVSGISVYSTPLEFKQKLEEFSFINEGDVSVAFGNHARVIGEEPVEFNVFRWLVTLKNGAGGDELIVPTAQASTGYWIGSEFTRLRDTGRTIQIESPLPIGNTRSGKTPQQPGAIAVVDWIDSVGWTINALEARFIDTDAADEVEYS